MEVVVAGGGDIEVVDSASRSKRPRNLDRISEIERVLDPVGEAEPNAENRAGADGVADRPHHLEREAHSILERSAVLVFPLVPHGREKLVQEVGMRHMHLDAVEAALQLELGAACPPLGDLHHFCRLDLLRNFAVCGSPNRRRAEQNPQVIGGVTRGVQAKVVELGDNRRALATHGVGHAPVHRDRLAQPRHRIARHAAR